MSELHMSEPHMAELHVPGRDDGEIAAICDSLHSTLGIRVLIIDIRHIQSDVFKHACGFGKHGFHNR